MENNNVFEESYSQKMQEEVKQIRERYIPKEENKMDQLRKLDQSVTKPGMIAALILGIVGSLIMGVGMCCVMVWGNTLFAIGIVVGIIGMVILGAAYPMYVKLTEKEREKLAPQILALADELAQ